MSDDEKRGYIGGPYGGVNNYGGAFGGGCCGGYGGANDLCEDDYFIQVLCPLKGELVKVLTEADEVGIIVGRLVTIGRDYIAVSCDGTVAYILLCQITAIIPVD